MAKRLKLRLSRILSNCRSKDFPSDPIHVPKSIPSSMITYTTEDDSFTRKQTFRWKKEKEFHVISISTVRDKPIASAHAVNMFPRPSAARRTRRRRTTTQWERKHGRVRLAPVLSIGRDTSRTEDEDRDLTELLMSSASSSDEEGCVSEDSAAENVEEKGVLLLRRRVSEVEFEARLSLVEKRWRCGSGPMRRTTTMMTKVRESYAVVKRTEDPYGEFRRSIMEMVTEKEIYEEDELRELLRCLLSLNGREHHGIILRAFAEVCDALFRKKIMFDRHRDCF